MSKINSFGAQYKLAKNTWNAPNFEKTYAMINSPYYPFVSQSAVPSAGQAVESDPALWGSNKMKQCACGKVISQTQIAEGYSGCGGCGTDANNYHDVDALNQNSSESVVQQSPPQDLNNESDQDPERRRKKREELASQRLHRLHTNQLETTETFQPMYSNAMTYGTIPMAPGDESYQVNQNLGTNYTTGARPDMSITQQGGIDFSENASSYIKGSGTFCSDTNGGKKLRF